MEYNIDDPSPKIFNDSVHGHIELHPLLVKIIDTPQFQRLRNIKQLGATYYTYPGACHNRFEHCIGTCHLAGRLLGQIRLRQPNVCDGRDELCVQIAGLCHDLGHGPFSHMFDSQFVPAFHTGRDWKHEEGSCKMLDHLIAENDLKPEFEKYGLNFENDVTFIKELINPPSEQPYKGRPKEKNFLYEIICNKKNGVDVDKWDYFARDCQHLGIPNSFDHNRIISNMMVVTPDNGEGTSHIAARDKDCNQLYDMFHVRSMLHRTAYQHRVNTSIETMICDAMTLANDHIFYKGENGKRVKISDCIYDMFAYTRLTDSVVDDIMNNDSSHEDMVKARHLIHRIHTRQLYQCCASARIHESIPSANVLQQYTDEIAEMSNNKLKSEDIFLSVVRINYGDKERNPMDKFLFYCKNSPGAFVMRADEISSMLPKNFQDCYIRVYCRDKKLQKLTEQSFRSWCPSKGLNAMRSGLEDGLTPRKAPAKENGNFEAKRCRRSLYE